MTGLYIIPYLALTISEESLSIQVQPIISVPIWGAAGLLINNIKAGK